MYVDSGGVILVGYSPVRPFGLGRPTLKPRSRIP